MRLQCVTKPVQPPTVTQQIHTDHHGGTTPDSQRASISNTEDIDANDMIPKAIRSK